MVPSRVFTRGSAGIPVGRPSRAGSVRAWMGGGSMMEDALGVVGVSGEEARERDWDLE
jgi:hypothetical protein